MPKPPETVSRLPSFNTLIIPRRIPELPSTDMRDPLHIIRGNEIVRQNNIDVPVSGIIQEGFIVDVDHVNRMAQDLQGPMGQRSPITLRAREDSGEVVYDIVDGFHRSQSFAALGWPQARANVFYNLPDVLFYDARIKDTTVKSVSWARIAEWVTDQWKETPWAKGGY